MKMLNGMLEKAAAAENERGKLDAAKKAAAAPVAADKKTGVPSLVDQLREESKAK